LWGDTVHYDTGYVLKWTIKVSHLCLRFGALFVGSMRLEYVGPKTSPGHGPIVQATIKRAMSPTVIMFTLALQSTANFNDYSVCTVQ